MDEILDIELEVEGSCDNEHDALFNDMQGSSQVKPVKSDRTSKPKNLKEIKKEEIDDLLRDMEWTEDPVTPNTNSQNKLITEENVPEPTPTHLKTLRKHFGHAKFRPMQWEIIHNILECKRDGCVIMATGYGKSLCYQFPPVYCNGTTLVITPLISLMEDQTLALEAANIPACYLGAAQSGQREKINGLINGDYRVVYLTPEFCTGDTGINLFNKLLLSQTITLVAIDEAHCVSQWGHDFRHSYRRLGKIRDIFGHSTPILALTATATKQVQDDICSSLKLRNPFRFCSGFDRPNLYLAAHSKGLSIINDLRRHMVRNGETGFGGPTIVYCPTKKATENVAKELEDFGVNCRYYHADMNSKLRKEVHHKFVRDEIQVIVATVAFGMGIDKPDVRLIIHYGAPKDMESYYQEVGRAGRDGLQSHCHCYFSNSDFTTNQYFLSRLSGQAYDHRKQGMLKMEQYLQSRQCRRQFLLSHFEPGRSKNISSEYCCDNCTFRYTHGDTQFKIPGLNEDGTYNFSEDAKLLLSAVNFFGSRFGITTVIKFLSGSKDQRFRDSELKSEIHGKGSNKSQDWWRGLGRILLQEGYLEEVASKYNAPGRFPMHTIKIGKRGVNFLASENVPLSLYPSKDMLDLLKRNKNKSKPIVSSSWCEPVILPMFPVPSQTAKDSKGSQQKMSKEEEEKEGKLYNELLKLRNDLAKQHEYMPYMVANNKTLIDVAALRPRSTNDLALVEGLNAAKIEKFGAAILKLVRDYCQVHGLEMKKIPKSETETTTEEQKEQVVGGGDIERNLSSLNDSIKLSYNLFQIQGMEVKDIAAKRKFHERTINDHLVEAFKIGLPLDISRLGVTEDIQKEVIKAIRSPPVCSDISRLRPIKNNCPKHIEYEHIKITLALLTRKYGLNNNKLNGDQIELGTFKHVPIQKSSLSSLSSHKTPSQVSSILSNEGVKHQESPKRKYDLSHFRQNVFKDTHRPAKDDSLLSQKKDVCAITEEHNVCAITEEHNVCAITEEHNISGPKKSHMWKEINMFESVDTSDERDLQPKPKRRQNVDLSQLKQTTVKGEYASKSSSSFERNKSEQFQKDLWEDDDIFEHIDVPNEKNANFEENREKYPKANSKGKFKDYQEQMKKKMKTCSIFRN